LRIPRPLESPDDLKLGHARDSGELKIIFLAYARACAISHIGDLHSFE
jgi:hypothetical protein